MDANETKSSTRKIAFHILNIDRQRVHNYSHLDYLRNIQIDINYLNNFELYGVVGVLLLNSDLLLLVGNQHLEEGPCHLPPVRILVDEVGEHPLLLAAEPRDKNHGAGGLVESLVMRCGFLEYSRSEIF